MTFHKKEKVSSVVVQSQGEAMKHLATLDEIQNALSVPGMAGAVMKSSSTPPKKKKKKKKAKKTSY